jgi:hypothetical protein
LASSEEFFGRFIKLSAANFGTKSRKAGEKENNEQQPGRLFSFWRYKDNILKIKIHLND